MYVESLSSYARQFLGRMEKPEDVGDAVYRVDRCIMQLIRGCNLDKAAGIVIGTVTDWEKEEKEPPVIVLEDVWRDLVAPLGISTVVRLCVVPPRNLGRKPDRRSGSPHCGVDSLDGGATSDQR